MLILLALLRVLPGARGGRVTEERVLSVKQKLLAEVLRQKQELEKKQATRLANKMDTLQRQIQTNGHKKSRFHFGKKKGDETPTQTQP
nr:hypothetical protein BaRGS_005194 [Batillaria attramentaria]